MPSPLLFSLSVSTWAIVLHPSSYRKFSQSYASPAASPRANSSASALSCVLPSSACSLSHGNTTLPFLCSTASSIDARLIDTKFEPDLNFNRMPTSLWNQCLCVVELPYKRWGDADRRKHIVWLRCVKSEFPCCCFHFCWKNYNNECLSKL